MDSAGLGQLVQAYSTSTRLGAGMKLAGLTKRLTDLLTITRLLTVFETYEGEREAVASFSATS